jgi:eukaryotic-like serine/threonine-protein kinase
VWDATAMTLTFGTHFAEYEIVGSLGRGGMGEVYRARDSRLQRDVALKVLPDLVAADSDRLARFEREAQLLASLNHPNIAAIHGVREHAGVTALVLELVDGPTLAELLTRGPLSLAEALDVARQLASALECAHERGIVHRDVKPANIKMTNDGQVKVLDFGLAKALGSERFALPSDDESTTVGLATKAGVILGTAPYMSPEQAKGQPVDRRTDIWSFGCVLYEMLAGRRAFEGQSFPELLAAIVTHDIDFSRVPADAPSRVRNLVRRCLDPDPKQRLRDIGEARIILEHPRAHEPATASVRRMPPATWLVACIAGGLLIGAFAMSMRTRNRDVTRESPVHLLMSLAPADRLAGDQYQRPLLQGFAISSRGRFVVFGGSKGDRTMIYRRALADTMASPVAGTEGGRFPILSPDERWVGFISNNSLLKVPIEGGTASTVCAIPSSGAWGFAGASWGEDGTIVIGLERGPLWQVRASGGAPQHLTELDTTKHEASHRLPHHLPGGHGLLYTATSGPVDLGRIVVLPAGSPEGRTLVENAADARYRAGRLLYVRNATLFAAPFDLERLTVTGAETAILERVMQSIGDDNPAIDTGAAQFDLSDAGTLVYAEGGTVPPQMNRLLWIDRTGGATTIGDPGPNLLGARLSADGHRIAVALINNDRQPIRIYDLERGGFTGLPDVQGQAVFPVWTPDGQQLVFGWNRNGQTNAYAVPLDGSAAPRRITSGATTDIPGDITPDGRSLAYVRMSHATGMDIYIVPLDGSRQGQRLVASTADDAHPAFSPDGRWLAYSSSLTGEMQVFITSFPGPGPRLQVSTSGGRMPVWSPDGRRLAYVSQGVLVEATVQTSPLRVGSPSRIVPFEYLVPGPTRSHDAAPDGHRFLVTTWESRPDQPVTSLQVVLNWLGR